MIRRVVARRLRPADDGAGLSGESRRAEEGLGRDEPGRRKRDPNAPSIAPQ